MANWTWHVAALPDWNDTGNWATRPLGKMPETEDIVLYHPFVDLSMQDLLFCEQRQTFFQRYTTESMNLVWLALTTMTGMLAVSWQPLVHVCISGPVADTISMETELYKDTRWSTMSLSRLTERGWDRKPTEPHQFAKPVSFACPFMRQWILHYVLSAGERDSSSSTCPALDAFLWSGSTGSQTAMFSSGLKSWCPLFSVRQQFIWLSGWMTRGSPRTSSVISSTPVASWRGQSHHAF